MEKAKTNKLYMPFSSDIQLGQGIYSHNASQTTSAFEGVCESKVKNTQALHEDKIYRYTISSRMDHARKTKAKALFSFEGWGADVQANFTLADDNKCSSNSVTFVAGRDIVHGFEGYRLDSLPGLSKHAKECLAQKGEQAFQKIFGDYFVDGFVTGSSIKIAIRCQTTQESNSQEIAAGIEGSFSNYGVKGSGGANFAKSLEECKQITSSKVEVKMSGHSAGGGIQCLDIDKAEQQLIQFGNQVTGVPISVVLYSYKLHPEYTALLVDTQQTPIQLIDSLDVDNIYCGLVSCQLFILEISDETCSLPIVEKKDTRANLIKLRKQIGEAYKDGNILSVFELFEKIDKIIEETKKRIDALNKKSQASITPKAGDKARIESFNYPGQQETKSEQKLDYGGISNGGMQSFVIGIVQCLRRCHNKTKEEIKANPKLSALTDLFNGQQKVDDLLKAIKIPADTSHGFDSFLAFQTIMKWLQKEQLNDMHFFWKCKQRYTDEDDVIIDSTIKDSSKRFTLVSESQSFGKKEMAQLFTTKETGQGFQKEMNYTDFPYNLIVNFEYTHITTRNSQTQLEAHQIPDVRFQLEDLVVIDQYVYQLKGVLMGLKSHVYAYCLSQNGQWYNNNDSNVYPIDKSNALQPTNVVLLFYIRIAYQSQS